MQTALDFLTPVSMDPQAADIWHVLRFREGRERAIKVADLAELVRISPRNCQRIVHRLIHDFGRPIGTSMSEPHGWFHAVTHEERAEVAELHRRRALAELTTAARIMAIDRRELLAQIQTELDAA